MTMIKFAIAAALAATTLPVAASAAEAAKPAATAPAAKQAYTSADTDIGTLLDDAAAKAIVEKYIPGFTTNPQVDMARAMTLKAVQAFAPDEVTDDRLAKIDAELAKLK
jgi:para-nitrobenzyl esterase